MAKYTVISWQDIPSVVEASDGTNVHRKQLAQRFQELIDEVAMRTGLAGTDAYLEKWSRGEPIEREGAPEEVANAVAEELEANFESIKAEALGKL